MSIAIGQRSQQTQRQQKPNLLEARCTLADDAVAPMTVGATVAATMRDWGIAREAGRVRRVAVALSSWLLANEHPRGEFGVYLRLEVVRRELIVVLSDAGTVLPDLEPGSRWRSLLHGCLYTNAHRCAVGRELACGMKIRPDWIVRLTWRPEALSSLGHPTYTYDSCDTSEQAFARAGSYLRGVGTGAQFIALLEVHVQGPQQVETDEWELVGRAEPEPVQQRCSATNEPHPRSPVT